MLDQGMNEYKILVNRALFAFKLEVGQFYIYNLWWPLLGVSQLADTSLQSLLPLSCDVSSLCLSVQVFFAQDTNHWMRAHPTPFLLYCHSFTSTKVLFANQVAFKVPGVRVSIQFNSWEYCTELKWVHGFRTQWTSRICHWTSPRKSEPCWTLSRGISTDTWCWRMTGPWPP